MVEDNRLKQTPCHASTDQRTVDTYPKSGQNGAYNGTCNWEWLQHKGDDHFWKEPKFNLEKYDLALIPHMVSHDKG